MFCVSGMGTLSGLDSPCGDGDGDESIPDSGDGDGSGGFLEKRGAKHFAYPRRG
jgi:hypothetical protein